MHGIPTRRGEPSLIRIILTMPLLVLVPVLAPFILLGLVVVRAAKSGGSLIRDTYTKL